MNYIRNHASLFLILHKPWTPNIICLLLLMGSLHGKQNYDICCYFFLTKLRRFSSKTRHKIKYADVKIVCTPILYTADMLPPNFPTVSKGAEDDAILLR